MIALDKRKNFAYGVLSTGYNNVATSITLGAGQGARFGTGAGDVPFNAVWWDYTSYPNPSEDPNKEIVRVTGISGDTLTITRAQEGTSATNKNTAGKQYRLALTITKKFIDDLETGFNADLTAMQSQIDNLGVPQAGNGVDGDVTISGTTTLTRDMAYNNLTIGASGILITNGFKVFVKGTTTINTGGVIHNDGGNGGTGDNGTSGNGAPINNGGAGGVGGASGTLAGGITGRAGVGGKDANTTADPGVAGSAGLTYSLVTTAGGAGGAGGQGTGGGAGGTAGGAGSAGSAPQVYPADITTGVLMAQFTSDTAIQRLRPATSVGGSGGGGSGHNYNGSVYGRGGGSGGSGGTGGIVVLVSKVIINNGTIRAKGGNGGTGGNGVSNGVGYASGGGGAGAGGHGGVVVVAYKTYSGSGSINVAGGNAGVGGTGGTGATNGGAGSAGSAGLSYQIQM